MRPRHAWLAAGALLLGSSAAAQQAPALQMPVEVGHGPASLPPVATNITPDTDPTRSLGTIVTPAGAVQLIDGGTRAGNNLFHSFAQFDLARGNTARFVYSAGDPAAIHNVVSRVTGGAPSHIDGTVDSTALPNADFWFINPAGIMFGAGASVNVPAAAHFTTAQALRFADGVTFAVTTPGGSTFSVANPAAFGFLGGEGAIRVEGVGRDFLPRGGQLTLAARDVEIESSDVAGTGFLLIGAGGAAIDVDMADPLAVPSRLAGNVEIDDSVLRLTGTTGGAVGINIGGGAVHLRFADLGTAFTAGPDSGVGGPIRLLGHDITLFGSLVSASTFGAEIAGDISIVGNDVLIDSSNVTTETREGSTGESGLITISADRIRIVDRARVTSSSQTTVPGGAIILQADRIDIDNGVVESSGLPASSSVAGAIFIRGGELHVTDAGSISTSAFGNGDAGTISIAMDRQVVLSRGSIDSDLNPDLADSTGRGGSIFIETPVLTLLDESRITSNSFSAGDAGLIGLSVGSLLLDGGSLISSDTSFAGAGGRIEIEAHDVALISGSSISSQATEFSRGRAGDISVSADSLSVLGDSSILSSTSGSGNAGTIAIDAGTVRIEGAARVETASLRSSGDAGSIVIGARDFTLGAISTISSSSLGSGRAGQIRIAADTILVDRRSNILSVSVFMGDAGSIELSGRSIRIDNFSFVSSDTTGAGAGGDVRIAAGRLEVGNFSQILSSTFGSGNGGQVSLAADMIDLFMGADIASRAEEGSTGNAGTVRIQAGTLVMHTSDISSATHDVGAAGAVIIGADTILLDEDSHISSSAPFGVAGRSGSVSISGGTLVVAGKSSIETISTNRHPAGSIVIAADAVRVEGAGSFISSANESEEGGDAGTISIDAGALTVAEGAQISTSSIAGAAGDITIRMPGEGLLRLEGVSAPGLITTSSGPGTGGRIIIAAPRAIISNGGSILALGEQGGANVQIQTGFFISSADRPNRVAVNGSFLLEAQVDDVSRGTVERDLSVIDASGVLRGQCAAVRRTGRVSQLVVRPVGPYARPALADPLRPDTCA